MFSSALIVTLFFGGYHLPFIEPDGIRIMMGTTLIWEQALQHWAVTLIHVGAFFGKTILMVWLHVFVRWTLPRFRYDQVMKLGWTKLLPLALANIVITAAVLLLFNSSGAEFNAALDLICDITQALVAVGGFVALVWLVTGLLEAPNRPVYKSSTAARYAAAAGGVRAGDMQA